MCQAWKVLVLTALIVLLLGALWLGTAMILDCVGRRSSPEGIFDAIVVPGCRVRSDGSPSGHLQRRVETAVAIWRQGRAPIIVFSGGGQPSEAGIAARYAECLGLTASAVILEERSRSTEENARSSAQRVDARRVLVVTDSYHVARSQRIFRRYFDDAVAVGVVAPVSSRLRNALREVLANGWDLMNRRRC